MPVMRQLFLSRTTVRLLVAASAAALMAGCSDASRFAADPFADPFGSAPPPSAQTRHAKGYDGAPTGSISPAARVAPVKAQPLPPANYSVAAAPAPAASAPTAAGNANHWTTEGGTPIVLGEGETVPVVANRYGVPADVLFKVNGYSVASPPPAGARIIVPVYHASAAKAATPPPVAHAAKEAATPPVAHVAKQSAPAPAGRPHAEPPTHVAKATPPAPKPAAKASAPAKPEKTAKAEHTPPRPHETAAHPHAAAAEKAKAKAKVARKDDDDEKPTPAKPAKPAPAAPKSKEKIAKVEPVKPAPLPAPAAPAPKRQESKAQQVPAVEQRTAAAEPAPAPQAKTEKPAAAAAPAPAPQPAADEKVADAAHPEFRWPAHGRIIQCFSCGGNDGINIAVPEGTQVKAAESGVVAYAGSELKGYGNLVLIRHPNGFVSAYAHNGELSVKRGDQVSRGQTIAKSGQSGNVGSPQLHFELRKGSTPVDPTTYLAGG